MNVTVLERDVREKTHLVNVDCDIHPGQANAGELEAYLPARWRAHLREYGPLLRGGLSGVPTTHFRMMPNASRADAKPPTGGAPGSDLDFMRAQHLDPNGIEYGILIPLRIGPGSQRNLEFGAALAAATNDWQAEKWLDRESRLRGSILVTQDEPAVAIAEIEKRAKDKRFVQIVVPPKTVEPLGRSRYWPLLEAAEAFDLPIALHVGGINGHPITGAGWPSFYIEDHHTNAQIMQGLVSSLVLEGCFERFPRLKIVLVEGGFAWAPALAWRLDKHWERMLSEVPHLTRPPSDYMRTNIWYTTQPVDEPREARHMRDIIRWIGADRLLFSTDYPHWDFDDPRFVFKEPLPPEQKEMIFRTNAKRLFKLA
jgi:predicted TIM-barrel fold metal-dependent hydrolase